MGNIGAVVPVKNPEALSGAVREVLALDTRQRRHIGKNARNRIIEHYSLQMLLEHLAEYLPGTS